MHRVTTNVEPEMYDYTSNNWSHWGCNEKLKEKFGSRTRKTFDRLITKDSYTWNITHNTEGTAV
jgi:predicted O-methyltransferase YrrM